MEVAAAVAAHDLELAVDGFDEIGRGKKPAHIFGVLQKGQIMFSFFAKVGYPRRVGFGKMVAKLLELILSDVDIPTRLNRAPAFVELDGIGFGEMSFRIALHVNGAELDTGGPVRRLIVVCVRTSYSIQNGYHHIEFTTGVSGSLRAMRAKSTASCEIVPSGSDRA